jgi:hypothetical protein
LSKGKETAEKLQKRWALSMMKWIYRMKFM